MIRCAYILSFDRDSDVDYKALHEQITHLQLVLNWFHYIKSSYVLVASTNYVDRLNNAIAPLFKDKSYLLMKVSLIEVNGFLPQKAWDWIDKQMMMIPVSTIHTNVLREAQKKVSVISSKVKSFKIGKTGMSLEDRLSEPDYNGKYDHILPLIKGTNPDIISGYESSLIDAFIEEEKCDNDKNGNQSEGDRMVDAKYYYVYLVWRV